MLEHGYLTLVERPHGLPAGRRQVRDSRHGPLYRDVVYGELDQVVELDGRMWHDSAEQHDADLDRDLDAAVEPARDRPAGVGPGLRPAVRDRRTHRAPARRARLAGPSHPVPGLPRLGGLAG